MNKLQPPPSIINQQQQQTFSYMMHHICYMYIIHVTHVCMLCHGSYMLCMISCDGMLCNGMHIQDQSQLSQIFENQSHDSPHSSPSCGYVDADVYHDHLLSTQTPTLISLQIARLLIKMKITATFYRWKMYHSSMSGKTNNHQFRDVTDTF